MQRTAIEGYARLRLIVGAIGEGASPPWWPSQLFTETALRLLHTHLFPRTAVHAAVEAATVAARRHHDVALAGVSTYHLFRLPPDLEQEVSQPGATASVAAADVMPLLGSHERLLEGLAEIAGTTGEPVGGPQDGPISCGPEHFLRTTRGPAMLASEYLRGFTRGSNVIPYCDAGS